MKIASCRIKNNPCLAVIKVLENSSDVQSVLALDQSVGWPQHIVTMNDFIANQAEARQILNKIVKQADQNCWQPGNEVDFEAPISNPRRNIICLGWNYAEHAKESANAKDIMIVDLPKDPIVFTKATTTVNGPFDEVIYDEQVTRKLDWEVELGVIIGNTGRHIPEEEALDYVFGYTVINDISARDLQKRHQQFFLGKSVDGTCPMGPWIVTADEIPDPQSLNLSCHVNGIEKQNANTDQMIFTITNIISTLSKVMTLMPGDIIATGTPSGVGFARTPPEYLQHGDIVECEIEAVGKISNKIV